MATADDQADLAELNGHSVKFMTMHMQGKNFITNGIRLDIDQMLGYQDTTCNPCMLFYYEERKLESKAGISRN